MDELGGLWKRLPFIGGALLMAAFAGCGLPGFANFAGEITVFFAAWKAYRTVTILACWGALLVGAIYMLRAVRQILHGPLSASCANVADAPHVWRKAPFAVLIACLLCFGFAPRLLTDKVQRSAADSVSAYADLSQKTTELPVAAAAVLPAHGSASIKPSLSSSVP
jgi:NADH-quinone oxidoreductase subunit M